MFVEFLHRLQSALIVHHCYLDFPEWILSATRNCNQELLIRFWRKGDVCEAVTASLRFYAVTYASNNRIGTAHCFTELLGTLIDSYSYPIGDGLKLLAFLFPSIILQSRGICPILVDCPVLYEHQKND